MDIDYTQYHKPTKNGKYEQKVSKNTINRKETSSTLKKKAAESRKSSQSSSTLNKRSKSKESLSNQTPKRKDDNTRGSSSTLYKKKEKQTKENNRYTSNRDDRRISQKSMSVESLGSSKRNYDNSKNISRSTSMPRDPEKSAGWFKINRKK